MKKYISTLTNSVLKLNILIVDDESDYLKLFDDIISNDCKQKTHITLKPAKAIELVEKYKNTPRKIDAAFIDIYMDQMNGIVLGKTLKKIDPCLDIILISSDGSLETKGDIAEHAEFITSIDKYIRSDDITKVLCKLLSKKIRSNHGKKSLLKEHLVMS